MPVAGHALVPINYGNGPALFTLNLRLSKTWGIGPKVQGGAAREVAAEVPVVVAAAAAAGVVPAVDSVRAA